MLAVPEKHVRKPVVLADWVEASVLFFDDMVSSTDVIDRLLDAGVYQNADTAARAAERIWAELERREEWIGPGSILRLADDRIERRNGTTWTDDVARSFCVALSLRYPYGTWSKRIGADYITQGYLFECLTEASLRGHGWQVHRTGWASGIQNTRFRKVVDGVADILGESIVVQQLVDEMREANEAGLDIVCFRRFRDERGGRPIYLLQCASGADWREKLKTPDIDIWTRLIIFTGQPQRAFAMPHTVSDHRFKDMCRKVNGMVFDRYRLLSGLDRDWLSYDLRHDLLAWLEPKVADLAKECG
jgi:hypothetical protein